MAEAQSHDALLDAKGSLAWAVDGLDVVFVPSAMSSLYGISICNGIYIYV